ncbi:hypothetical protein [Shewanella sp. GutDb-MelDb]|uniref:hypothetical protein n=1 Tax=Shewanella sp. GutDb-MelDb TaxID=2058316 RepID=UPI000C7C06B4|nr:hypothetical protein [Shewanella sp. GutDb-MelDb]PKG55200.1 hypothetical protein CXF82_21530 [Shewanella sp. GutDb-MelDb]
MKKLILFAAITISLSACGGEVEHNVNSLIHPNKDKPTEQVAPTLPAVKTPELAKEPPKLFQRVPQLMTAGYQAPSLQPVIAPKPLYQRAPLLQPVTFKVPSLVSNGFITPDQIKNLTPTLHQSPVNNKMVAPYKLPSLTPSISPQRIPMLKQLTLNTMLTPSLVPVIVPDMLGNNKVPQFEPIVSPQLVPMKTPSQLGNDKIPTLEPQAPKEALMPSLVPVIAPSKTINNEAPQLSPVLAPIMTPQVVPIKMPSKLENDKIPTLIPQEPQDPLAPSLVPVIAPNKLGNDETPQLIPELAPIVSPQVVPVEAPNKLGNDKVPTLIESPQPKPLEPQLTPIQEPKRLGNAEVPVLSLQNPGGNLTPSEFPVPQKTAQKEPLLPECHINKSDISLSYLGLGTLNENTRYVFSHNTCNPLHTVTYILNNETAIPLQEIVYQDKGGVVSRDWKYQDGVMTAHAKIMMKPTKEQEAVGALMCFADMNSVTQYGEVIHRSYKSWCNNLGLRVIDNPIEQMNDVGEWKYDSIINRELSENARNMYYQYSKQALKDSGYEVKHIEVN